MVGGGRIGIFGLVVGDSRASGRFIDESKRVRASAGTARVMWFWWKPGDSVMCGAGPELDSRRLGVWSDG